MKPKTIKTKSVPSPNIIPSLVERGFALHQQLLDLNEEFKEIKDRLKSEAVNRPGERVPLAQSESQGDQWIARGAGCECHIVFPGPHLVTDLDPADTAFAELKALSGDHFNALFRKVTIFQARDKKAFRGQVANLLHPEAASALLELCTAPTEPKALWKARRAEKEAA